MTMPTLSVEAKVENFMRLRDTSADFLSSLAQLDGISGASTSRLYQSLRDETKRLPTETAVPLEKLIDDLDRFCASFHPVPVSLRNAVLIHGLLKDFRTRREESVRPVPFEVVLIGPRVFKRIVSGVIETTTSYSDCAAFKEGLVAYDAARLLDGMGQIGVRFTTITNERRDPATFVSKLADIGFES